MSMRVSIDREDPGYLHTADLITDGYAIRVYLNGDEVMGVVTADETEGYVLAHRFSPEGRCVQSGDSYVYEKKSGQVKIVLKRVKDDRILH